MEYPGMSKSANKQLPNIHFIVYIRNVLCKWFVILNCRLLVYKGGHASFVYLYVHE
jgi:hypothetical protein